MSASLESGLRRLRLGWMAQSFEAQNSESLKEKHSYLDFLGALVEGELEARDNKGLAKRIKAARFPLSKTLEEFAFDFQPKLDVKLVKTLASCDFVTRRENVIFDDVRFLAHIQLKAVALRLRSRTRVLRSRRGRPRANGMHRTRDTLVLHGRSTSLVGCCTHLRGAGSWPSIGVGMD